MPDVRAIRDDDDRLLIGWYGCSASDSVLSVRWRGEHRNAAPRWDVLLCPGCGEEHYVAPLWRNPVDYDEWKATDAALP